MQGREGLLYIHAVGQRVASFTEIPNVLHSFTRQHALLYIKPPVVDDDRPKETSWTLSKFEFVHVSSKFSN